MKVQGKGNHNNKHEYTKEFNIKKYNCVRAVRYARYGNSIRYARKIRKLKKVSVF